MQRAYPEQQPGQDSFATRTIEGEWKASKMGWGVNELRLQMSAALRSFLDRPGRPPDALTYHEVQGFLFAVTSAPELIQPSEWMPIVLGEETEFASHEEAEAIFSALMAMYNNMNGAVYEGRAALPGDCEFRADVLANFDDDAPVSLWSRGYKRCCGA